MNQFMIVFTAPSGKQFAMADHNGNFALAPIDKLTGAVKSPLIWKTHEDAAKYWDEFSKWLGFKKAAKLHQMNPMVRECKTNEQATPNI